MQSILHRIRTRFLKWTEAPIGIPVESLFPVERIGTPYGGWLIPQDLLTPESVCYFVGAGEDISFDLGVAAKYGCQVHIFDPTPRAVTHFEQVIQGLKTGKPAACSTSSTGHYPDYPAGMTEILHFHPIGIWNEDTVLRFFAPQNAEHVSHSIVNLQRSEKAIEVPVRRLAGIMREEGHKRIDVLKIDIEGAEYQVIESILEDRLDIDVLCIEYDESAANHLDAGYIGRIRGSLQSLTNSGYHIIAKEKRCHNYTLIHRRLL